MSVRINWTSESEKTFNQNLDYLSKEWDVLVLNGFLDRVEEVHRCVVHERIVLYDRIVDDETIDLLTFWNTSQDPGNLKV